MKNPETIAKNLNKVVNIYLLAKAFAMQQREKVDSIERSVLADTAYYADGNDGSKSPRANGERITDPKRSYNMHDKDFHKYYTEVRNRLEKAGYKIKQGYERDGSISKDRWNFSCPALVAENLERLSLDVVIDAAIKELNLGDNFREILLCSGLETFKQFGELTVRMVVNSEYYTKPLIAA
jgi:hypothetical protein